MRKKKVRVKDSRLAIENAATPSGVKQVLDYHFIQELKSLPFIENIFLFGSRTRGDSNDRSDIDLAIECPNATDDEWDLVMKIIEDADTLLKIDCVRYDQIKNQKFLNAILKNHRVLLGKQKK